MNSDTEFDQDERAALEALANLPPIEPPGDIRERQRTHREDQPGIGGSHGAGDWRRVVDRSPA